MLLSSTYYSQMPTQHVATHAPIRSSPLRERSTNSGSCFFDFSMPLQRDENQAPHSQRTHKANPIMQTRDAATKRRREMFFKRVQNNREDRKWESRGEQLQQLDFVSERKRWEIKKAQEAPPGEEETNDATLSDATLLQFSNSDSQREPEITEAEYMLAQEEYELQQLVASMETEQLAETLPQQHYGSDDEDYDQIFMECATAMETKYCQHPHDKEDVCVDIDDMDMTDG